MSYSYVPRKLRKKIEQQARYICGYCRSPQILTGDAMEIEHIIPETLGGLTEEANLWLACHTCNKFKGDKIAALDPSTNEMTLLYNPRIELWSLHFEWSLDSTVIIGKSATGRATIEALQLNRAGLIAARAFWIITGKFPPED